MALENSVFPSRPDSLSLPVEGKAEGEEVEVAAEATASAGVFNLSEELGHVVTTETAPSVVTPAKVNRSFQAKLAEREATANQPRKKTQGTEKERGRFGWGESAFTDSCSESGYIHPPLYSYESPLIWTVAAAVLHPSAISSTLFFIRPLCRVRSSLCPHLSEGK